MKRQISKVAFIATLAFIGIGIGFAGTQQAEAANCPPQPCSATVNECVAPPGVTEATPVTCTVQEDVIRVPRTGAAGCQPRCTSFANSLECDWPILSTVEMTATSTCIFYTTPIVARYCVNVQKVQGSRCVDI